MDLGSREVVEKYKEWTSKKERKWTNKDTLKKKKAFLKLAQGLGELRKN